MQNYKETTTEAFNIKDFILTALSYKYLYIASFVIFLAIAFVINKVSPTVYEVSSVIGPVEDKRSSLLESNNLFSGLGTIGEAKNLQNDINSLSSFSLISATLSKLNLEIGYFVEKKNILGQKMQIYPAASYTVTIDKSHIQPINAKFYIDILDEKSFRLKSSEDRISLYNYVDNMIVSENNVLRVDTICNFNATIKNKNFKFSIFLNPEQYTANLKNKRFAKSNFR